MKSTLAFAVFLTSLSFASAETGIPDDCVEFGEIVSALDRILIDDRMHGANRYGLGTETGQALIDTAAQLGELICSISIVYVEFRDLQTYSGNVTHGRGDAAIIVP
jgi:hypothetical protein